MPSCFQLTAKANPEAGPVRFIDIDDAMCRHFGVEPDQVSYYYGWYDFVGLRLAVGLSWSEIANECAWTEQEPDYAECYAKRGEIVEWLRQNYTSDAWHEFK